MGNNPCKEMGIGTQNCTVGSKELALLWVKYDVNGQGTLSHKEAIKFLHDFARASRTPFSTSKAKKAIAEADTTGSGALLWSEFLALIRKQFFGTQEGRVSISNSVALFKPKNRPPTKTQLTRRSHYISIAVLGAAKTGKTSLILQCLYGSEFVVDSYEPTVLDVFKRDENHRHFRILDTPGRKEFSFVLDECINDCDGFVLVYSLLDTTTLNPLRDLACKIVRIKEVDYFDVPFAVVGTHLDSVQDPTAAVTEEAMEFANSLSCKCFLTSAKTGENCVSVFAYLSTEILKLQLQPETRFSEPTFPSSSPSASESHALDIEQA